MRHAIRFATFVTLMLVAASLAALDVEERYFDSDGVKIRYLVKGKGEPLVLIHGFTASAEANWGMSGILDRLAEVFQVIAIDARGHGKSDKPHDASEYGTKMVDDVINLLDHLGIEKANVGGYSMGGFLTLKLLATHPDRLLSAVIGAAGWSEAAVDNTMMNELAASLERGEGIKPLLVALHPADQPPLTEQQIEAMNQMVVASNDQAALAAVIHGMEELSVSEEQLRSNGVPTLAIIGSRDPLKLGVDAMQPVMKSLEVKIIDGADHLTAIMNPQYSQLFAEGVLDFLVALCNCA